MTTEKARKRAIRERMSKTGERYAAARRHTSAKLPPRVAEPGKSDATVRQGTGKAWDQWFRILDDWGAAQRTHRDIAKWLREEQGVPGWWAQTVTVGYERARGMRALHETTTGFQVSVQRTLGAPEDRVAAAFTQARQRNRWLERGAFSPRASMPSRAVADFDAPDGSRVTVYLVPKGDRTAVQIMQTKMPSSGAVTLQRTFWRGRLAALAEMLGG